MKYFDPHNSIFSYFLSFFRQNCHYAHGVPELKPREVDTKYKTEFCQLYHSGGICKFGKGCNFIHDEYRIRASEYEFWMVCPRENIIRVEIVDPTHTKRIEKLKNLSSPNAFQDTKLATEPVPIDNKDKRRSKHNQNQKEPRIETHQTHEANP
jgi:hypothetical protein